MMCELKTKSQMILRIAELSEENSLLKDTIEELKKESKTVTECFFKRSDYARDLEKEKEQLKKEIGILENLVKVFESSKDDSDKLVKECERLKKLYESAKSMNGCCAHRIAELEQENEILKEKLQISQNSDKKTIEIIKENERLKSIVESNNQQVEQAELLVMDNDRLQQEVENLKDTIYYDVERYKQTLQEIMKIVRKEAETRMLFADEESFCDFCKIQDIINKTIGVENERKV